MTTNTHIAARLRNFAEDFADPPVEFGKHTGSRAYELILEAAQALEAAELGEGKAQGRPCKVGGACVATKTSPCACRDLPSPTPPQAPALDAQGELVTVRLPTLTAEQAADVSWCLSAALVDAGRIDDGRMLMFVGEAVTPPPPAVGKPLSEKQIFDMADSEDASTDDRGWGPKFSIVKFARLIERAHGIVTKESGNG